MDPTLRFLELCRRELQADDARLELGGRPPQDPHTLVHALEADWRLVLTFTGPVADRDALAARLRAMIASFADTLASARMAAPVAPPPRASARSALDDLLTLLGERVAAIATMVIDQHSPIVWGASADAQWLRAPDAPTEPASNATAIARALVIARSGADTLRQEPEFGCVVRAFSEIYRVVLVFGGPFSALHAEATTIRALGVIERMVTELPPEDPSPSRGGQIVRLPRK